MSKQMLPGISISTAHLNVVSPGMVLTPAMQTYLQNNAGAEDWMKQTIPFGRLAQTEEIAKAVLLWRRTRAASSVARNSLSMADSWPSESAEEGHTLVPS